MSNPRIVLFGPPLAGKTTIAQAVAKESGAKLRLLPLKSSVVAADTNAVVSDGALWGASFQIATIGGATWNMEPWVQLCRESASIILVLDPQRGRIDFERTIGEAASLVHFSRLGCTVLTKGDLVSAEDLFAAKELAESRIAARSRPPTFFARSDKGASLLAPIEWSVRQLSQKR